jgi:hypothetical protein
MRAHAGHLWLAILGLLPLVLGAEEIAHLDARSCSVSAPFFITNGCLCQRASAQGNKGRAVYEFIVTNSGSFVLQGLVSASSGDANSLVVNVDSEPDDPAMIWEVNANPVQSLFHGRYLISRKGSTRSYCEGTPATYNWRELQFCGFQRHRQGCM